MPSLDDWEKDWQENPQRNAQRKLLPVDFWSPLAATVQSNQHSIAGGHAQLIKRKLSTQPEDTKDVVIFQ